MPPQGAIRRAHPHNWASGYEGGCNKPPPKLSSCRPGISHPQPLIHYNMSLLRPCMLHSDLSNCRPSRVCLQMAPLIIKIFRDDMQSMLKEILNLSLDLNNNVHGTLTNDASRALFNMSLYEDKVR
ncbi:predicted protein [Histoplasma capsulatum var. duboisii H88]|uniref:Predicted protein n=2 Tax=Ajellomyces capsulatus TaxID=5037 RepID=F0UNK6_AJEC8|nr:predicted protein [Histoplasma capsulatum H143]EGC47611.1 predicted protein [Histoplasma capsulatum var. duboisii H88]